MTAHEFNRIATCPFFNYKSLGDGTGAAGRSSESHEGFVGFIRAKKIDGGEMEVPVQMLCSLYELTSGNVYEHSEAYSEMAVPLIWKDAILKKSADSILCQLLTRKAFRGADKIQRITTSKEYIYYGGPGIVLKEERGVIRPLLLYTFTINGIHRTRYNSIGSVVEGPKVIGLNLRVAPSVFSDTDSVSKCIVKKLIPALLKPLDGERFPPSILPEQKKTLTPKVIVEDLSNWILQPVKPKISSFDHDLRQFFADERIIDEIIDGL